MFWDKVAFGYEQFEKAINGRVTLMMGVKTAAFIEEGDEVLECACGTGLISRHIAPKCRTLTAVDLSVKMLAQAEKNCAQFDNIRFFKADITHLKCRDERFDKVVAGNVIHLLDDSEAAVRELMRVCKKGGKVIIPTYVSVSPKQMLMYDLIDKTGAKFKRMFTLDTYKQFFADMGLENVRFEIADGVMPCVLAVIDKQ
ncbi:Methyltransferase domain-containing protein [Ruminococcus sp. YE71]|uniref:class I SAM-dependent methyltransferase n=1 Tax=unclassified Ruminococcus TaxID=2608920 RepID=UPI00087FB10A|nr:MULTISPECIES: class I SAM-dependent methyltransferase [unclassified Ruminococcus]SDA14195.1 Methyltransferase domain-containing protein [Ruminococcus sp. YE78]SFW20702.1 Methyltransferase domain-containing protein [Ruminococcus sp. YE71]